MNINRRILHTIGHRQALVIAGAALAMLAITTFTVGCGDSGTDAGSSTAGTSGIGGLTRPATGMVEVLDARSDITGSQNLTQAPSWLDINWVAIAQAGNYLKFDMDLAGKVPDTMPAGIAAEWGIMFDTDSDGTPDWVVYESSSNKDGWVYGLYNYKTKERLTGPQFPGDAAHSDTKITLTVNPATLGTPKNFKWLAFTNDYSKGTDGENLQAGDKVPDNGAPENSVDWLPYP